MTTAVVQEDIAIVLSAPVDWSRLAGATVLVTGATGMIGQYVVHTLAELGQRDGSRVLALSRRAERGRALFGRSIDAGVVDLLVQDVTTPIEVPVPVDIVVHAASPADPVAYRTDPVGVIRANVTGTDNVLSLAAAHGATVCLLSTMEVYGRPPQTGVGSLIRLTEDALGAMDSLDLRSAYPLSKRMAENLCVAYRAQHGVPYRIARLSHTYGPGMELSDPRVQAYFLRQALDGADIVLNSDGTLRRTYTYVSDAVSALFHLLCGDDDLTCNVADESAQVSIRELAELVLRHGDSSGRAAVRVAQGDAAPPPPASGVVLDCTRLRAMGWTARVDLPSGVARTVAHHRSAREAPTAGA
ncbi:NAD-dependent epimerase/dehydratase family protein [Geodermatophilus sabuli]|uniref:dTDP-glucose 4,6-dehydratase n=1 Tax=Geodermatophilus sabuli TaxID=1564158 RepID=A0A285EHY5_9ACTN|nr:NAD-dependent epimerase/dehydratase family protein [Geodermatophilus sabuli]MBB3086895.1 dTDP-glucose 4,6-dehydratase [Geodermatophilus sabuli]SNX98732.1 dTDP-glucose 4,6-dehydratase [Geodermatophilus sabuli]